MLVGMWNNWNSHTLLIEMQNCVVTLENILTLKMLNMHLPCDPAILLQAIYLKAICSYKNT